MNTDSRKEVPLYIGQAGVCLGAKSYISQTIGDRILQHMKAWLANGYEEYCTGLNKNDFRNNWRYKLHVLQLEPNHEKRLEAETRYIDELKPILQDTCGNIFTKYPSKQYYRNDLCISPWRYQRRMALEHMLASI